jgi:hypothetical protein
MYIYILHTHIAYLYIIHIYIYRRATANGSTFPTHPWEKCHACDKSRTRCDCAAREAYIEPLVHESAAAETFSPTHRTIFIHLELYLYIYTYIHIYIYTYIHIYIYTYIHIYIHIRSPLISTDIFYFYITYIFLTNIYIYIYIYIYIGGEIVWILPTAWTHETHVHFRYSRNASSIYVLYMCIDVCIYELPTHETHVSHVCLVCPGCQVYIHCRQPFCVYAKWLAGMCY